MHVLDLRYVGLPHPESVRSIHLLSEFEAEQLSDAPGAMPSPGWLAARWLIKSILQRRHLSESGVRIRPQEISTLSLDEEQRPTRPCVLLRSEVIPLGVSIAHTARGVLVAVARCGGLRIGVDLTYVERRVSAWDQWYTPKERQLIEQAEDPMFAATFLSVKQAYYKATNDGEPFRPRQFEVTRSPDGSYKCESTGRRTVAAMTQIAVANCDNHMAAIVLLGDQRWASVEASMIPENDLLQLSSATSSVQSASPSSGSEM